MHVANLVDLTLRQGSGMQETATRSIITRTNLHRVRFESANQRASEDVPQGRSCKAGFCIWDALERDATRPKNVQIDICC
jgi:hypothetical protein